jgi:hypothetical protein
MQYEKSNHPGVQMDTLRKCKPNLQFLIISKISLYTMGYQDITLWHRLCHMHEYKFIYRLNLQRSIPLGAERYSECPFHIIRITGGIEYEVIAFADRVTAAALCALDFERFVTAKADFHILDDGRLRI